MWSSCHCQGTDACWPLVHLGEKPSSRVESRVGGWGEQEIPSIVPSSPKDSSLGETFDSWGFPLCLQMCHGKSWENPSEEPEPCYSPSLSSSELVEDAGGKKKKPKKQKRCLGQIIGYARLCPFPLLSLVRDILWQGVAEPPVMGTGPSSIPLLVPRCHLRAG